MADRAVLALAADVVSALERAGDPQRARGQRAYMKSAMPFHGVPVPTVRRLVGNALKRHELADEDAWQEAVRLLWRRATHREQRYAAVEVLLAPGEAGWLGPAVVPLIEELVTSGAWWDTGDALAINGMGAVLRGHAEETAPLLLRWAEDDDFWKRRTAILAQLKFKEATDEGLLCAAIEPSIDDPVQATQGGTPAQARFFLRKAIGWALREYSKTNARFVIDYVHERAGRLAPLSKREALKVLLKNGAVAAVP